jgi:hypothetical protein
VPLNKENIILRPESVFVNETQSAINQQWSAKRSKTSCSGIAARSQNGHLSWHPSPPSIPAPRCYTPARRHLPAVAEQVPGTGSNGRLLWKLWNQCLRDQCYIC